MTIAVTGSHIWEWNEVIACLMMGVCVLGVSVRGVHVRGGSVLSPCQRVHAQRSFTCNG